MTLSVCFNCGEEKAAVFFECWKCHIVPLTENEYILSLALSEHISSKSQLAGFSHEIKNKLRLTIPESLLSHSQEILKNPHLLAILASQHPPKQPSAVSNNSRQKQSDIPREAFDNYEKDGSKRKQTMLHKNAFLLIGATTRDDRRRIVELAEEKSLELNHDICQKIRSDLTNPRTRLGIEMSWLPGVSPRKASQLIDLISRVPLKIRSDYGLPPLAHVNLLAAEFEVIDSNHDPTDIADFIKEIAFRVDQFSPRDILRDINEDRAVSGFPEVKTEEPVGFELLERKRYYRNAIIETLDRLPTSSLIRVMTLTIDSITNGGLKHAPELIDELVDSYEIKTQDFLRKEAENIFKLIKVISESTKSGENAIKTLTDKLENVARNWDRVAQPIQLSAKSRGIEHGMSNEIAHSIRSLAVDLYNKHDMLAQSKRITHLLQELFSELPEVAAQVQEDVDALESIFQNRKQIADRKNVWAREITGSYQIGTFFKGTLSISPAGITWKERTYTLNEITRVRWGGIRRVVNGIPTGTTYILAFGDNRSEDVIELKTAEIYTNFLEKLWRAVCVGLVTKLLEALRAGKQMQYGDAVVRDDGVTLIKHKFLGFNESAYYIWDQTQVWTSDGAFYIGAKNDSKTYVELSYIHTTNAHILEQVIQMAFKHPGLSRLSELLDDDESASRPKPKGSTPATHSDNQSHQSKNKSYHDKPTGPITPEEFEIKQKRAYAANDRIFGNDKEAHARVKAEIDALTPENPGGLGAG